MSRPVLISARIRLEPMTTEHLPFLVELDGDAEVLRHILGRARSAAEVHDFWGPICADIDADAVGLGWWIGIGWRGGTGAGDTPRKARRGCSSTASRESGWRPCGRRGWR